MKIGLNEITNEKYHEDREFISSSGLKLLNKDPEEFKKKHVDCEPEPPRKVSTAFELGSYVHSLILEPHLVDKEYAVYPGFRRSGPDWKKFQIDNPGKVLLNKGTNIKGQECIEAFKLRQVAVDLIQGGFSEQTVCQTIGDMKFKTRYDYVNVEKGYIADVKTSAYAVDQDMFKMTIEKWQYDLSAALYLAVCEKFYGKPFDFYFIAIGKADLDCQVYRLSEKTRAEGERAMWKAIERYHSCIKSGNWKAEWSKAKIENDDYEILDV